MGLWVGGASAVGLLALIACAEQTDGLEPGSGEGAGGSGATPAMTAGGKGSGGTFAGSGSSSGGTSTTGGSSATGGASTGGTGNGSTSGGSGGEGEEQGEAGNGGSGKGGDAGGTSGGSGGGTGGVSGSGGGSGGTVSTPRTVNLLYTESSSGASTSTVSFKLNIKNLENEALPLAMVTIRYWMTVEGSATPVLKSYYQGLSISLPTFEFKGTGTDTYVEFAFVGKTIAKNADINASEIQLQVTGGTFDQSNDHSYQAKATQALNEKITMYLSGTLIWGCEPGGACAGNAGGSGGTAGSGGAGGTTGFGAGAGGTAGSAP